MFIRRIFPSPRSRTSEPDQLGFENQLRYKLVIGDEGWGRSTRTGQLWGQTGGREQEVGWQAGQGQGCQWGGAQGHERGWRVIASGCDADDDERRVDRGRFSTQGYSFEFHDTPLTGVWVLLWNEFHVGFVIPSTHSFFCPNFSFSCENCIKLYSIETLQYWRSAMLCNLPVHPSYFCNTWKQHTN